MQETTKIQVNDKGTFIHYHRGERIFVDATVTRVLSQKCFKISYMHPKYGRVVTRLLQHKDQVARFQKEVSTCV